MAPKIAKGSPRRRQEAQHSAKMGQLGSKMGPQIWLKSMKNRFKIVVFFIVFFDRNLDSQVPPGM